MRFWTVLAAILTVVVLVPVRSVNVEATNWYGATGISNPDGCAGPNMTDNLTLTYRRYQLTSKYNDEVNWAMNFSVDPTAVGSITELQSADTHTDIVYHDSNYGSYCGFDWWPGGSSAIAGLTECRYESATGTCDRADVHLSTNWANDVNDPPNIDFRRVLVCQETGHALGLDHRSGSGSCMPATFFENTPRVYSDHDKGHIACLCLTP